MAYENQERQRSQSSFRTSMDIGMGIFYTAIGGIIMYAKAFGKMTVPPAIAYILGAMMVIGGLFRLYRGIKNVSAKRQRL